MERGAGVIMDMGCIDAIPAGTGDESCVPERQGLDRSILYAYAVCLLAWLGAYATAPANGPIGGHGAYELVDALLRMFNLVAVGVGAMAAFSAVWAHVAHLAYQRRPRAR